MRILFLLFFGYLVYRFLIKPVFIGMRSTENAQPRAPQNDLLAMMRRMEELKRQHYQQQQQAPQKAPSAKRDGEYIDYEEIE